MEMILYVRTINVLRGFFVDLDRNNHENKELSIKNYLVLPDFDEKPPYFGFFSTSFFWIVCVIALINSTLAGFGLYVIAVDTTISLIISCYLFLLQFLYYYGIAWYKEENYEVKRHKNSKGDTRGTASCLLGKKNPEIEWITIGGL